MKTTKEDVYGRRLWKTDMSKFKIGTHGTRQTNQTKENNSEND